MLGTHRVGAPLGVSLDDLEPAIETDVQAGKNLKLFGMDLPQEPVRAGSSFATALYWERAGDGAARETFDLTLTDSAGKEIVRAQQEAPIPAQGRGVCTAFDLEIPQDAASGRATLMVNAQEIGAVTIAPK